MKRNKEPSNSGGSTKNVLWIGLAVLGALSSLFLRAKHDGDELLISASAQTQQHTLAQTAALKSQSSLIQDEQIETKVNIRNENRWSNSTPETEVQGYQNQTANYKRFYSVNEREIPTGIAQAEKIYPRTQEGILKIQQAVGLPWPQMNLALGSSSAPDFNGVSTSRFHVFANGLQVYGSGLILNQSEDPSGVKEQLVADVIKQLPPELPREPQILVEDAFEKANEDIRTSSKLSDMNTKLLSKGLVYFPSRSKLALAWHVLVHTPPYKIAQDEEPEGRWNYFIDAITGAVLEKMNEVHTTNDQASGPGGNGERNLKTWNNELDVKYSSSQYSAKTKRFVTYDLIGGRETPQNPVSGASLVNFGNAASNNAHGYTEHVLNMLKLFGYNSINDKGFKIVSRVNYSSNYANAFWNGEMNYGDGGSHFYNLASDVGVVSHEIGHGFTAYQSNLDYIFQSGGLNESFSDIAGVTAKFYLSSLPGGIAESGANFLIGDKAVRLTAPGTLGKRGYIRNMCEPTEDGRSIDHFKNYNDTLNVHHSSGIMNKAFCLFAKRLANNSSAISGNSNPDSVMKAAEIFFYANKTQWLDYFTFHEAAEGTIQAARLLAKRLKLSSAQIELLKLSWSDVGFNVAISAPTRVSAKVVNGSVVLSWVAPTGTAPIVRNTFSYSTGWGRWSESISAGSSAATSFTIPSGILPKGAPYIFKMSTCTSSACSSWSKPSEQIKYTEAGAPFISDVEFDGGPLEGWYQLTVWGTGFGRNSKIAVGDNLCSTTVFISSREIICKPVPAASGGAGVVAVRVTNPNGKNATMPLAYLYRDIRPR